MVTVKTMKHRDEGSVEEVDESVAEQAERRAKVTNAFLFVSYICLCVHRLLKKFVT